MKFAIFFVAVAVLGAVNADNESNKFVDDVIDALKREKNFDPLSVHDYNATFDHRIGLIDLMGRIEFRQTKIHGLSYIARNGDALVDSDDQGFEAKLRLGDSNVKVSSSMTIQLGALIHNQYDMEAEVGDIDVQFATSVDSDGNFELKDFKIDQLEHVKVTLHGVTIIDKLTEQIVGVISELFIAFFNGEARKMISDTIRPMMANELKHLRPH